VFARGDVDRNAAENGMAASDDIHLPQLNRDWTGPASGGLITGPGRHLR